MTSAVKEKILFLKTPRRINTRLHWTTRALINNPLVKTTSFQVSERSNGAGLDDRLNTVFQQYASLFFLYDL
jgi:hypothetical protein